MCHVYVGGVKAIRVEDREEWPVLGLDSESRRERSTG